MIIIRFKTYFVNLLNTYLSLYKYICVILEYSDQMYRDVFHVQFLFENCRSNANVYSSDIGGVILIFQITTDNNLNNTFLFLA